MKVENFRKLEKLEIKNIYCPVCRRWTRGSLHRCSKTECFNAISFGVLSGKIHLNIIRQWMYFYFHRYMKDCLLLE